MAPAIRPSVGTNALPDNHNQCGPQPSTINVANPYIFHQQIQYQLVSIGANPSREDSFRLAGVQWISEVRTALQLPVRTFATACTYYHKFRLAHKDTEYQYHDAAAAALLTACKIEDTLKKSKEVLCAAHNLKVPAAEHLSPDDHTFEGPSRSVIGLERLMLEASGFDFRVRYPQKHLVKFAKFGFDKEVVQLAYDVMIDLYRTFSPLKQTCATMACACLELATLVLEKQQSLIRGEDGPDYKKLSTTRAEIMETMLDLLDLYTHFQKSSLVGPLYDINTFIQIRIKLNQELEQDPSLNRYTEFNEPPKANGFKSNVKTPKTPITPASPSDARTNGRDIQSPATLSPRSAGSGRRARGQDGGTIRFMLDAEEARREKDIVAEYFKDEYEEYVVEVEEPIKPERDDRSQRGGGHPRLNGRERHFYPDKRIRR